MWLLVVYTWRMLEPTPGHYDFSAIRADQAYLDTLGKKLWVQLQDKSFTPRFNVPDYLLLQPRYGGGVLRQSMESAPERDAAQPLAPDAYGWVAMQWKPAVRARYQRLIRALGRAFDGQIAGINLSESAIDIGVELPDGRTRYPPGFTPAAYVQALHANMGVLAQAFRQSVPMVYLNFVPGEWLPWQDQGYMRGLFAQARRLQVAVGGPDLLPYRKGLMAQSYRFFHDHAATLVKGMAVQQGNLQQTDAQSGRKNTVASLLDFAQNYLGLHYLFWSLEDPANRQEILARLPGA